MSITGTKAPSVAPPRSEKKSVVLLFVALMLTMLMASLSQTILSTALPTIVGELGGVEQMTWVITGYVLASTVMMPVYGRISDIFGRKPVLIAAISLFIAGSVVGGLAQGMGMLIAARVLQGIGGGGLMILSQAAIADVVPARERGKYMGIMGAVFAVSSVAGPLVGGWLTEGPGWRWAFWLNVPLGVISLVATALLLHLPRRERAEKARIDYLGMALIAGATVATVLVCTWGGATYAWGSFQILGLIALAVVLAAAFIVNERRAAQPVIPLDLFRNRNFTMATIAGLLIGVAMFGVVSYMPTYVQMVTGVDATVAGLLMVPMMGGLLAASIVSGQLVSRTGRYKMYPLVGAALMAVGLFLTSTLTVTSATWLMCTYIAIFGIGIGLGQQILVLIVQDAFPVSIVGTATAAFNYFKQVGATVGSAIVGTVFASKLADSLATHLAAVDGGVAGLNTEALTPAAVADLPDQVRVPIIESYNEALLPILLWLVPVGILAAVVLCFVKEKVLSTRVEQEISAEALSEGQLLVGIDESGEGTARMADAAAGTGTVSRGVDPGGQR